MSLCCLFNLQVSCYFTALWLLLTGHGLFTVRTYFLLAKTADCFPWRKYCVLKMQMTVQVTSLILPLFECEKQNLRKLVRIFDFAFPTEPTGGSVTCHLCCFLYPKWFASQPCLFRIYWNLFVLVPALPSSLNADCFFLGAYFPDTGKQVLGN